MLLQFLGCSESERMSHLERRRIIQLDIAWCTASAISGALAGVYAPQPRRAVEHLSALEREVMHALGAREQARRGFELPVGGERHPPLGKRVVLLLHLVHDRLEQFGISQHLPSEVRQPPSPPAHFGLFRFFAVAAHCRNHGHAAHHQAGDQSGDGLVVEERGDPDNVALVGRKRDCRVKSKLGCVVQRQNRASRKSRRPQPRSTPTCCSSTESRPHPRLPGSPVTNICDVNSRRSIASG